MAADESNSEVCELVNHLFRRQAGQIVTTLTRYLGPENLQIAEDAVQDALLRALRLWPFQGIPERPEAWLFQVARNRCLDVLRAGSRLSCLPEARRLGALQLCDPGEARFSGELKDSQLKLMFICCHPAVPPNCRAALTLKTLGGFGVSEIATGLLLKETAVAQRLVRAKRKIRVARMRFTIPGPGELLDRLDSVLKALYLMFNEGYQSARGQKLVRQDVCQEAIRLCEILAEHSVTGTPKVCALAALFHFQAARFPARTDEFGDLLLLSEQDSSRWDRPSIVRGFHYFERSARGDALTEYHLQAEIASCHVAAGSGAETDWRRILRAYDRLLAISDSPVVALNRSIALAQVEGPRAALLALEPMRRHPKMLRYAPFYLTLARFYRDDGNFREAELQYRKARELTSNPTVRRFIRRQLEGV